MSNYGLLLNVNTAQMRGYFDEMVRLLGVIASYRSPVHTGNYTTQGEFKAFGYSEPIKVGVLFEDHETQKTAKLLGWNSELSEKAAIIHVPYDLPGLEIGCTFEIPGAFDKSCSRLFRVTKIAAQMIYPASVTCEIVPEYESTSLAEETTVFNNSNFNMLNEEDD